MEGRNMIKLLGITILVYGIFRYLLPWILPFIVAVGTVQLVRRGVALGEKYLNLRRGAALLLCCGGSAVALIVLGYLLLSYVGREGGRWLGYCQEQMDAWRLSPEELTEWLPERLPEQLLQTAAGCVGVFVAVAVALMASVLFYQDYESIVAEWRRQRWYPALSRIREAVSDSGVAYLRTQGIIVLSVAAVCGIGLALLGYEDTVILGILIGIVDFLPILGAGTVLIPWAVILVMQESYMAAAGVAVIYLICAILRQYLEPKLMGQGNGIRPFYMLICIYVGVKLFGIWGVFLGPLGVALVRGIYQEVRS